MAGRPDRTRPALAGFPTRRGIALFIVVLGATWTLLTGACTGWFALMELQLALIFGGPLVLGGVAMLNAGYLLRGDPTDPAVRRWAWTGAVVAALGVAAAIGLAVWSHAQPDDEYKLNELAAIFALAGAAGALVLLAVSLRTLVAGRNSADRQAAGPETDGQSPGGAE